MTLLNWFIFGGLFAVVLTWIIDHIQEWFFNRQLKDLLIEELKENLLNLNENIYWANESGRTLEGGLPAYFLEKQIFTAFITTNKIIIFNAETRKYLFNFYAGVNRIYTTTQTGGFLKIIKPEERQESFIETLLATKRELKKALYSLKKGELYEESERKGKKIQLTKTEKI